MTSERRKLFDTPASYRLAFTGALLFYALIQLKVAPEYFSAFRLPDIDDEMRLVMVRDLLNGHGWYDMVQYRALPPDGLPMHWSRLVDLPLAALTVLFSWFADQMTALQISAAVWPFALFVLYLSIIGRTMISTIGYAQASFSVMAAAATPSVASTFFALGRVDHHNLQIVCMTVALALILRAGNPVRRGMAAGLISAFSLAVGLETIVFFTLLGTVLSLAYVFDRPGSVEKLGAYGFALGLFAPLFFVLQTTPQDWTVARCDQLSPITLALTTLVAVFALLLARLRHRVRSRALRFGLAAVLVAAMFAVLWPGLEPCREGSFSTLPPEVVETIRAGISESLSLGRMFALSPPTAVQAVLPYLALAGTLVLYLLSGARPRRLALILLAFVLLAVAGMFYQIRTILWGHPALAMGFGIVMAWMLNTDWNRFRRVRPLGATAIFVLVLFPSIPVWAGFETFARGDGGRAGIAPVKRSCTDPGMIALLNGLPSSGILAPLDFGTKLLLYTHHAVFALPYHRRPEAYVNGTLAFYGDEGGLVATMDETGADYVMVCAGMTYDGADSIGSKLARGERPEPFDKVMEAGDLTVFKRKEN